MHKKLAFKALRLGDKLEEHGKTTKYKLFERDLTKVLKKHGG